MITLPLAGLIAALIVVAALGFLGGIAFWELTSKEPHEYCDKH